MTPDQSEVLTRIDERTKNLESNFALHVTDDKDRFDRMFSYMEKTHKEITTKMDTLWDKKNKDDGAIGMGKWMAGAMGGVIVAAIDYMMYRGVK